MVNERPVKTSVKLKRELWLEIRIESIRCHKTMSEIIGLLWEKYKEEVLSNGSKEA